MPTRRNKEVSSSKARSASRHSHQAAAGSHTAKHPRSSRRVNCETVNFSSQRRQRRATRGYIDTIIPDTSTGETKAQRARRMRRREYNEDIRRRATIRRVVIIVICCVVVAAIAVGVGIATFFGTLDGKVALQDSDAETALVPVEEGEAFYALVSADLDENGLSNIGDGPDALMLVRVDPQTRYTAVVSIPADTQVTLSDGETHQLRDAQSDGDASLITAVSNLLGVDIAHFVKTDAEGIVQLTDSLDGIELDVTEEIDDPSASDLYIPAGTRTLEGEQVLTFLRASNFSESISTQAANQREYLIAVALRLISNKSFNFYFTLDSTDGAFRMDATASEASSFAGEMRGIEADSVYGTLLPGYETTDPGQSSYIFASDSWTTMLAALEEGSDSDPEEDIVTVDPASFTITVRNGSGITGAASQVEEALTNFGFKVTETGNTDSFAYEETLVIYHSEESESLAQTVISALGEGRAVDGGDYYSFDTDILVILGQDWKPVS